MAHLPKLKKKAVITSRDSLLSHGTDHDPSSDDKYKCSGVLHGEGVLVQQLEHISRLLHLGYYGKGIFSRSVPTHHCLPELPQLISTRQSKRKSQKTASDTATEAGLSSSAAKCSEWREKLKRLEEEEVKRVELHSQWKVEKEETAAKGKSQVTDEQKCSHLADQEKSFESVIKEDESEESSNVIEKSYHAFVERVKELRKADPYPVDEHLQLTSEEATYLTMEQDVLQVSSPDGSPVNTDSLWTHFLSMNDRFVEQYTAYRYYRSKGWVPKSGLKFGVDFLLYKQGPSFYHSSYAVVVSLIEQSLEPSLESLCKPPVGTGLTWREVIALDRVNEAAGKELIVCYVVKPPSLSQDQLKLPTCLASLQVREVFVKRWVPEKERQ